MLKGAADDELAAKIREAIGALPNEKVYVNTPQFERPDNWPAPDNPPSSLEDWWALHTMPKVALQAMGMGSWDGKLMLFPGEWYDAIPKGFVVQDISGNYEEFRPGKTDDDIRCGCLAYGVPAVDGEVKGDE